MIMRAEKMYRFIVQLNRRYVVCAAIVVCVFSVIAFIHATNSRVSAASNPCLNSYSAPYSAAEISNCLTDDVRSNIISSDANTRQRLIDNNTTRACSGSGFSYRRCRINYTAPYRYYYWITPVNQPSQGTVEVDAGTSVNESLQVNGLKFVASSLTPPISQLPGTSDSSLYGSDRAQDISWMGNNFPDDRTPISGSPALNSAAHRDRREHYTSITVTSGGGSASFSGSTSSTAQRTSSRYWFGNPVAINYSNPDGFTEDTTVEVRVTTQAITQSGSIYHCDGDATKGKSGLGDSYSDCPVRSTTIRFRVEVKTPPPEIDDSDSSANCESFNFRFTSPLSEPVYTAQLQERRGGSWVDATTSNGFSRNYRQRNITPGSYDFDIRQFRDFNQGNLRVVVYADNDDSIRDQTTRSVGPCLRIACGNVMISPSDPEAGMPFTATVRFDVEAAVSGVHPSFGADGRSHSFSGTIEGDGISNTGTMRTPPPSGTSTSGSFSNGSSSRQMYRDGLVADEPGEYELEFTINGLNPNPLNCPESGDDPYEFRAYDRPYVSVFGADVIAAGDFGTDSCGGPGTSGNIRAYFDESHTRGSGAQFAAAAIGEINGFSSAKMRASNPNPLKGLSFANSGSGTADENYGGNYQGSNCITDYYDYLSYFESLYGSISNAGSFNQNFADNRDPGAYTTSNALSIGSGVAIPDGKSFALFYENDIIIQNNITFANTTWGSPEDIPSLHIIVKGNIFITRNVTQLDGVFIAQPDEDGNDGNIYTCTAGGPGSVRTPQQMHQHCDEPLTIYGSLIARDITFNRYGGTSLRHGSQSEHPLGLNPECNRPVCAAETIMFSVEAFLNTPELPIQKTRGQGIYDSITSLPPIF